jgi:D-amino-acid dehydrogenase
MTARSLPDERAVLAVLRDRTDEMRREFAEADFVSNAAHELRNPLAGISGAIEVLQSGAKNDPRDRDHFLSRLADDVERMNRLTQSLLTLARVESLGESDEGVTVNTSLGVRRGSDAVVALGSWSPALVRSLGMKLPVQPGKGYSITYSRPALVPKRPMLLKDRQVCVTVWDSGFRLGSTMEFSGYDATLNQTRLSALERGAREYLHEPVGAVVQERWYGWRPMTWDDLPVLGRVPGKRKLWLATGHGMLGVSMSAASGQLMADLMTGRPTAIDPAPYRMERFL